MQTERADEWKKATVILNFWFVNLLVKFRALNSPIFLFSLAIYSSKICFWSDNFEARKSNNCGKWDVDHFFRMREIQRVIGSSIWPRAPSVDIYFHSEYSSYKCWDVLDKVAQSVWQKTLLHSIFLENNVITFCSVSIFDDFSIEPVFRFLKLRQIFTQIVRTKNSSKFPRVSNEYMTKLQISIRNSVKHKNLIFFIFKRRKSFFQRHPKIQVSVAGQTSLSQTKLVFPTAGLSRLN